MTVEMNGNENQPIRIAQIIGKMQAGGVEAVVFNYYRALDHSRFQFDIYYDSDSIATPPKDMIKMGARFIMLPPYQNTKEYVRELRRHLREENYSIVHSHLNTLSVIPLYAAWKEHIPVRIAHNHSVPGGNEFKRNMAKQVLRCFAKVFPTHYFACCEKTGRWLFGNRAFDSGKVFIVQNAVSFEKFQPLASVAEKTRKKYGLEGKFVVGHSGRFTFAKNHMFLLDIFKEILKRKPESVLLLVGDGELRFEIENGIVQKGLQGSVILTGKVRKPENYYMVMDVIALPSVFEGLPNTVIEGQVAGVPLVVSKAVPEDALISDGCTYMDLSESPASWAEAVIKAAGKEVHLNDAADNFHIESQVHNLENKYTEILNGLKKKSK